MSDSQNDGNGAKEKFAQFEKGAFFSLSKPYLDVIRKKSIFNLIYFFMAALNVVIPFYIIYKAISAGIFDMIRFEGVKYLFAFFLTWVVVTFACWIGFQLWWERRKKITALPASDFPTVIIFSELTLTFGEWIGTLIAIIGAGAGLFTLIFLGKDASELFQMLGLNFANFGVLSIIIGPVVGFFVIIFSRFASEMIRLCANLVDNIKNISCK